MSHDGPRRSRSIGISAFRLKEEPTSDCSKEHNTALSWGCGHVHPCCRLRFRKPATAPSSFTSTRAVARPQKPAQQLWRSPFTLSTSTPKSPCPRFVSIVAVTVATSFSFAATSGAWSVLRSTSSAFRESARSVGRHPSTSSEHQ